MFVVFVIPEVLGMRLGLPVLQRRVGSTWGEILGAKWMPNGLILGIWGSGFGTILDAFGGPSGS